MDFTHFDAAINKLPRPRVGFYPTPFHTLPNLSAAYGINLFMKREDMAGPSAISGSKMRLAEFILGRAIEDGVTHVITQGAYLTNSGLQFAAACLSARITPILVLTRNVPRHGELGEFRGNYLLNKTMGVETHVINVTGSTWDAPQEAARITDTIENRKTELEAQGHKVLVVAAGGAHPNGFIAHALTFREMLEQSATSGADLDFVYHTIGTGTALPGMLAAKLSLAHPVKFRSISTLRVVAHVRRPNLPEAGQLPLLPATRDPQRHPGHRAPARAASATRE
jgi:1-aminocyclopropane-1-carboxylate deaminase/D-cysteine desulfhydrase-like pyridoxal-dependent ACC family enzyme